LDWEFDDDDDDDGGDADADDGECALRGVDDVRGVGVWLRLLTCAVAALIFSKCSSPTSAADPSVSKRSRLMPLGEALTWMGAGIRLLETTWTNKWRGPTSFNQLSYWVKYSRNSASVVILTTLFELSLSGK